LTSFSQEAIQAGNGSAVAALTELHPEHHKARIGVPAAHIVDEPDLLRLVLLGMAVRPM
jgi:hypothetical protein